MATDGARRAKQATTGIVGCLLAASLAACGPRANPRLTGPTPPLTGASTRGAIRPSVATPRSVSARLSVLGMHERDVRNRLGPPSSAQGKSWTYDHLVQEEFWTRELTFRDGRATRETFRTQRGELDSRKAFAWTDNNHPSPHQVSVVGFPNSDLSAFLGEPDSRSSNGESEVLIFEWNQGATPARREIRIEGGITVLDQLSFWSKGDDLTEEIGGAEREPGPLPEGDEPSEEIGGADRS